jgi:ABC-type transporter Mla subunit MlaD
MGGPAPVSGPLPAPAVAVQGPGIEEVRADVRTSSNATQQAITGVGANLGKLSESVQGFGGDLARITTKLEAQVTAVAQLRSELSANATAQVGLKNDIEQLAVASRAGRDSTVSTIQFNKEMKESLIAAYDTNKYTVWVMCALLLAIVTKLLGNSRDRAEGRFKEALALLREAKK